MSGRIIAVNGPVIDVKFDNPGDMPDIHHLIKTMNIEGREIILEVVERKVGNIARCIALGHIYGIVRNSHAISLGETITVPPGDTVCGRVLNVLGEPIDKKEKPSTDNRTPIYKKAQRSVFDMRKQQETGGAEVMETGVKMIDLLFPLVKGTKTGILGGAALGKSILTLEIIHNIVKRHRGYCVFTGAGERIREGNELYNELFREGILDKVVLVFGQMNESPGARFGVVFTGVTIAESFQSKGEDVLLFVDNVFRFAQAGMEISALMGRIPSETGYQSTLASEISDFHERIRSGRTASITAIEAVYVPSDDLTDPAVVSIFSYLDSILILSRDYVQRKIYPAIDPLASSCSHLDPAIVGKKHFEIAQEVIKLFHKYEELRKIVSIIGIEELARTERILYERARRMQNFLTQPFFTAQAYTGRKGEYVTLEDTIAGCERIIAGRLDNQPLESLYMIGAL